MIAASGKATYRKAIQQVEQQIIELSLLSHNGF